jgi:integrase
MDTKTHGQVINEMVPGQFKILNNIAPSGSLQARKLADASVVFYWRFTLNGQTPRERIGLYDSSAPPKSLKPTAKGYSVQAAIRAAEALAQKHQANIGAGGYPALLAAEAEAKQAAAAARIEAAQHTLENLLDDYCDHLEALSRRSHKDARSIFKLHIIEPWPKIAALPANQVTGEQFADMMRKLLEDGKGRTSNKLRSYARSAYQVARAARSKASIPVKFKAYNITHNPVADTEPDESQNRADKNPLTGEELRTYWSAIKDMTGFQGAALRLHLLTGGQRIEQLVNLKTDNIKGDAILLFDGKGRPGKAARPHTVPLLPMAARAIEECAPKGTYALSTDTKGETHVAATTLSQWAMDAATEIAGFQAKRIRSGVETLLASVGVSQEIRGRLQSHGISGVQNNSYNAHDYIAEKQQALQVLANYLQRKAGAKVVQMPKRA